VDLKKRLVRTAVLIPQRLNLFLRLGVIDRLAGVHDVDQQLLIRHGIGLVDVYVLKRKLMPGYVARSSERASSQRRRIVRTHQVLRAAEGRLERFVRRVEESRLLLGGLILLLRSGKA
jgi:hypothetical protein